MLKVVFASFFIVITFSGYSQYDDVYFQRNNPNSKKNSRLYNIKVRRKLVNTRDYIVIRENNNEMIECNYYYIISEQKFNDNASLNKTNTDQFFPYGNPLKSEIDICSGFGYRKHPIYGTRDYHRGIDINCRNFTPIYATGSGIVEAASKESGYGNYIIINHGNGFRTLYAHLYRFSVKKNDVVVKGSRIGYSGNTGMSTGPHLHYEIIKNGKHVDPIYYIDK